MFSYFPLILLTLTASTSDEESASSSSSAISTVPLVVKSVLATTNYVDAYNSVMYMLPTAESQEIAINECGDSGKEEWSDNMFQLHQPYVPIHSSSQFQPTLVEAAFNQKWLYYKQQVDSLNGDYSDISSLIYEQFFDHSFALYKDDIIDNIKVVQDQTNNGLNWDILYTFMKWDVLEELDGKSTFISLLLYVPTTQVTIELITEYNTNYDQYLENEVVFETEPRMSFKGFGDSEYPWNSAYSVVPIKQSRAVTDLETNVAWYIEFMGAEILISGETEVNGRTVKYTNLFLNYDYGFEIGFYERSADDSYGEFPLSVYEKGINSVHRDITISSTCGFNRWFDNHYALKMQDENIFKSMYDSIKESGQRYFLFAFTSDLADDFGKRGLEIAGIDYLFFLYAIEPNGNTIEIVGYFEDDDLAYSTTQWEGEFCPEKCTDTTLFTKNFIDNGQYTTYGKTLDKYKNTLIDNNDHDNQDTRSKISKLISDSTDSKHGHSIIFYIFISLVIAFAICGFNYLLYLICRSKDKKSTSALSTEEQPLKGRYGSTQSV